MAQFSVNDRAAMRRMTDDFQEALAALSRVLLNERVIVNKLNRAADAVRRDSVKEILEALPVEELNRGRHGIRTSALIEEGIVNLWQVYSMNAAQLMRINGVGEQGAQKIKEIAGEFAASARETARIRLKADNPSRAQRELTDELYRYMHTGYARETAHRMLDEYGEAAEKAIKEAAPLTGGLSRLFVFGRRKAQAEEAAWYLYDLYTDGFTLEAEHAADENERAMTAPEEMRQADFEKNAAAYIALLESLRPEAAASSHASTGLPLSLIEEIDAMEVDLSLVKATLRPYQLFGCKYALHQGRVLLGDEMGLGKTVQAIAAMAVTAAEEGITHFMVVCPAGVLVNWVREIGVHSHLRAVKIHGRDEEALGDWLKNGGVGVTTYESIIRFETEDHFGIGMLVVDEAHYVKNPEAKRTQAMQKLIGYTDRVLFMSGTPLENRVEEMCFLVSLLNEEMAEEIRGYTNLATAQQFREKVSVMYLRRTREDVLGELPDLIENMDWSDLEKEEEALYRAAVREGNFAVMRQVSWQAETSQSTKAARLKELIEEAEEEKRRVIVFSFFLNTIEKVQQILGEKCAGVITGAVPPEQRQEMIDRFAESPFGSALICQIQAGGTGLNIQCASVIIFCEPQLKPSIEQQAIGRAYRMGQVRDVIVHRLLCEDTVDERILEILREKQTQFDHFADESEAGEEMLRLGEKQTEKSMMREIIRAEQERLDGNAPALPSGAENGKAPVQTEGEA